MLLSQVTILKEIEALSFEEETSEIGECEAGSEQATLKVDDLYIRNDLAAGADRKIEAVARTELESLIGGESRGSLEESLAIISRLQESEVEVFDQCLREPKSIELYENVLALATERARDAPLRRSRPRLVHHKTFCREIPNLQMRCDNFNTGTLLATQLASRLDGMSRTCYYFEVTVHQQVQCIAAWSPVIENDESILIDSPMLDGGVYGILISARTGVCLWITEENKVLEKRTVSVKNTLVAPAIQAIKAPENKTDDENIALSLNLGAEPFILNVDTQLQEADHEAINWNGAESCPRAVALRCRDTDTRDPPLLALDVKPLERDHRGCTFELILRVRGKGNGVLALRADAKGGVALCLIECENNTDHYEVGVIFFDRDSKKEPTNLARFRAVADSRQYPIKYIRRGAWHHAAACLRRSRRGDEATLFIDGSKLETTRLSDNNNTFLSDPGLAANLTQFSDQICSKGVLCFGAPAYVFNDDSSIDGDLAEIRLWTERLPRRSLASRMARGCVKGDESRLAACWPCDEFRGHTVRNAAHNGKDHRGLEAPLRLSKGCSWFVSTAEQDEIGGSSSSDALRTRWCGQDTAIQKTAQASRLATMVLRALQDPSDITQKAARLRARVDPALSIFRCLAVLPELAKILENDSAVPKARFIAARWLRAAVSLAADSAVQDHRPLILSAAPQIAAALLRATCTGENDEQWLLESCALATEGRNLELFFHDPKALVAICADVKRPKLSEFVCSAIASRPLCLALLVPPILRPRALRAVGRELVRLLALNHCGEMAVALPRVGDICQLRQQLGVIVHIFSDMDEEQNVRVLIEWLSNEKASPPSVCSVALSDDENNSDKVRLMRPPLPFPEAKSVASDRSIALRTLQSDVRKLNGETWIAARGEVNDASNEALVTLVIDAASDAFRDERSVVSDMTQRYREARDQAHRLNSLALAIVSRLDDNEYRAKHELIAALIAALGGSYETPLVGRPPRTLVNLTSALARQGSQKPTLQLLRLAVAAILRFDALPSPDLNFFCTLAETCTERSDMKIVATAAAALLNATPDDDERGDAFEKADGLWTKWKQSGLPMTLRQRKPGDNALVDRLELDDVFFEDYAKNTVVSKSLSRVGGQSGSIACRAAIVAATWHLGEDRLSDDDNKIIWRQTPRLRSWLTSQPESSLALNRVRYATRFLVNELQPVRDVDHAALVSTIFRFAREADTCEVDALRDLLRHRETLAKQRVTVMQKLAHLYTASKDKSTILKALAPAWIHRCGQRILPRLLQGFETSDATASLLAECGGTTPTERDGIAAQIVDSHLADVYSQHMPSRPRTGDRPKFPSIDGASKSTRASAIAATDAMYSELSFGTDTNDKASKSIALAWASILTAPADCIKNETGLVSKPPLYPDALGVRLAVLAQDFEYLKAMLSGGLLFEHNEDLIRLLILAVPRTTLQHWPLVSQMLDQANASWRAWRLVRLSRSCANGIAEAALATAAAVYRSDPALFSNSILGGRNLSAAAEASALLRERVAFDQGVRGILCRSLADAYRNPSDPDTLASCLATLRILGGLRVLPVLGGLVVKHGAAKSNDDSILIVDELSEDAESGHELVYAVRVEDETSSRILSKSGLERSLPQGPRQRILLRDVSIVRRTDDEEPDVLASAPASELAAEIGRLLTVVLTDVHEDESVFSAQALMRCGTLRCARLVTTGGGAFASADGPSNARLALCDAFVGQGTHLLAKAAEITSAAGLGALDELRLALDIALDNARTSARRTTVKVEPMPSLEQSAQQRQTESETLAEDEVCARPRAASSTTSSAIDIHPGISQLVEMGFPRQLCERALELTEGDVEAALHLMLEDGTAADLDENFIDETHEHEDEEQDEEDAGHEDEDEGDDADDEEEDEDGDDDDGDAEARVPATDSTEDLSVLAEHQGEGLDNSAAAKSCDEIMRSHEHLCDDDDDDDTEEKNEEHNFSSKEEPSTPVISLQPEREPTTAGPVVVASLRRLRQRALEQLQQHSDADGDDEPRWPRLYHVIQNGDAIHTSPHTTSARVTELRPGDEIVAVAESGDWLQVRLVPNLHSSGDTIAVSGGANASSCASLAGRHSVVTNSSRAPNVSNSTNDGGTFPSVPSDVVLSSENLRELTANRRSAENERAPSESSGGAVSASQTSEITFQAETGSGIAHSHGRILGTLQGLRQAPRGGTYQQGSSQAGDLVEISEGSSVASMFEESAVSHGPGPSSFSNAASVQTIGPATTAQRLRNQQRGSPLLGSADDRTTLGGLDEDVDDDDRQTNEAASVGGVVLRGDESVAESSLLYFALSQEGAAVAGSVLSETDRGTVLMFGENMSERESNVWGVESVRDDASLVSTARGDLGPGDDAAYSISELLADDSALSRQRSVASSGLVVTTAPINFTSTNLPVSVDLRSLLHQAPVGWIQRSRVEAGPATESISDMDADAPLQDRQSSNARSDEPTIAEAKRIPKQDSHNELHSQMKMDVDQDEKEERIVTVKAVPEDSDDKAYSEKSIEDKDTHFAVGVLHNLEEEASSDSFHRDDRFFGSRQGDAPAKADNFRRASSSGPAPSTGKRKSSGEKEGGRGAITFRDATEILSILEARQLTLSLLLHASTHQSLLSDAEASTQNLVRFFCSNDIDEDAQACFASKFLTFCRQLLYRDWIPEWWPASLVARTFEGPPFSFSLGGTLLPVLMTPVVGRLLEIDLPCSAILNNDLLHEVKRHLNEVVIGNTEQANASLSSREMVNSLQSTAHRQDDIRRRKSKSEETKDESKSAHDSGRGFLQLTDVEVQERCCLPWAQWITRVMLEWSSTASMAAPKLFQAWLGCLGTPDLRLKQHAASELARILTVYRDRGDADTLVNCMTLLPVARLRQFTSWRLLREADDTPIMSRYLQSLLDLVATAAVVERGLCQVENPVTSTLTDSSARRFALSMDGEGCIKIGARDIAPPWTAEFFVYRREEDAEPLCFAPSVRRNNVDLTIANEEASLEWIPAICLASSSSSGATIRLQKGGASFPWNREARRLCVGGACFDYEVPMGRWVHLTLVARERRPTSTSALCGLEAYAGDSFVGSAASERRRREASNKRTSSNISLSKYDESNESMKDDEARCNSRYVVELFVDGESEGVVACRASLPGGFVGMDCPPKWRACVDANGLLRGSSTEHPIANILKRRRAWKQPHHEGDGTSCDSNEDDAYLVVEEGGSCAARSPRCYFAMVRYWSVARSAADIRRSVGKRPIVQASPGLLGSWTLAFDDEVTNEDLPKSWPPRFVFDETEQHACCPLRGDANWSAIREDPPPLLQDLHEIKYSIPESDAERKIVLHGTVTRSGVPGFKYGPFSRTSTETLVLRLCRNDRKITGLAEWTERGLACLVDGTASFSDDECTLQDIDRGWSVNNEWGSESRIELIVGAVVEGDDSLVSWNDSTSVLELARREDERGLDECCVISPVGATISGVVDDSSFSTSENDWSGEIKYTRSAVEKVAAAYDTRTSVPRDVPSCRIEETSLPARLYLRPLRGAYRRSEDDAASSRRLLVSSTTGGNFMSVATVVHEESNADSASICPAANTQINLLSRFDTARKKAGDIGVLAGQMSALAVLMTDDATDAMTACAVSLDGAIDHSARLAASEYVQRRILEALECSVKAAEARGRAISEGVAILDNEAALERLRRRIIGPPEQPCPDRLKLSSECLKARRSAEPSHVEEDVTKLNCETPRTLENSDVELWGIGCTPGKWCWEWDVRRIGSGEVSLGVIGAFSGISMGSDEHGWAYRSTGYVAHAGERFQAPLYGSGDVIGVEVEIYDSLDNFSESSGTSACGKIRFFKNGVQVEPGSEDVDRTGNDGNGIDTDKKATPTLRRRRDVLSGRKEARTSVASRSGGTKITSTPAPTAKPKQNYNKILDISSTDAKRFFNSSDRKLGLRAAVQSGGAGDAIVLLGYKCGYAVRHYADSESVASYAGYFGKTGLRHGHGEAGFKNCTGYWFGNWIDDRQHGVHLWINDCAVTPVLFDMGQRLGLVLDDDDAEEELEAYRASKKHLAENKQRKTVIDDEINTDQSSEDHKAKAPWRLRVVYQQGATVRRGVEIESSEVVRKVGVGEELEATERAVTADGVPRYKVRLPLKSLCDVEVTDDKKYVYGWISEHLRGGQRDPVCVILRHLVGPGEPLMRYRVARPGGAMIRATSSLEGDEVGLAPMSTALWVAERVRLSNGTLRLRAVAPEQWVGWASEKDHIVRREPTWQELAREAATRERTRRRQYERKERQTKLNSLRRRTDQRQDSSDSQLEIPDIVSKVRLSRRCPFLLDRRHCASSIDISADCLTASCSATRANRGLVLGTKRMRHGLHYWEVRVERATWGSIFIGVAAKGDVVGLDANLSQSSTTSRKISGVSGTKLASQWQQLTHSPSSLSTQGLVSPALASTQQRSPTVTRLLSTANAHMSSGTGGGHSSASTSYLHHYHHNISSSHHHRSTPSSGWGGFGFVNYRATQAFGAEALYGSYFGPGDVIGVLFDADAGKVSFVKDGEDFNQGRPVVMNLGTAFSSVWRRAASRSSSSRAGLYPCFGVKGEGDRLSIRECKSWYDGRELSSYLEGAPRIKKLDSIIQASIALDSWRSITNGITLPSHDIDGMYATAHRAHRQWQRQNSSKVKVPCRALVDVELDTSIIAIARAALLAGLTKSFVNAALFCGASCRLPQGDGYIAGAARGHVWFIVPSVDEGRAWYWTPKELHSAAENGAFVQTYKTSVDAESTDMLLTTRVDEDMHLIGEDDHKEERFFDDEKDLPFNDDEKEFEGNVKEHKDNNSSGNETSTGMLSAEAKDAAKYEPEKVIQASSDRCIDTALSSEAFIDRNEFQSLLTKNASFDSALASVVDTLAASLGVPPSLVPASKLAAAVGLSRAGADCQWRATKPESLRGMSGQHLISRFAILVAMNEAARTVLPFVDLSRGDLALAELDDLLGGIAQPGVFTKKGPTREDISDSGVLNTSYYNVLRAAVEDRRRCRYGEIPFVMSIQNSALQASVKMRQRDAEYATKVIQKDVYSIECYGPDIWWGGAVPPRSDADLVTAARIPALSVLLQPAARSVTCGRSLVSLRHRVFFNSVKKAYWTALLASTTTFTSPPPDEYDRPDELREFQINRLRSTVALANNKSGKLDRADATVQRDRPIFSLHWGIDIDKTTLNEDDTELDEQCVYFDESLERATVFGQLRAQMRTRSDARSLRRSFVHVQDGGQPRAFYVKFIGEGVDDHSGPYRTTFQAALADEPHLPGIDIIARCDSGHLALRADNYIRQFDEDLYKHFGRLLGILGRHRVPVNPGLSRRIFWRSLAGQPISIAQNLNDTLDADEDALLRASMGLYAAQDSDELRNACDTATQLLFQIARRESLLQCQQGACVKVVGSTYGNVRSASRLSAAAGIGATSPFVGSPAVLIDICKQLSIARRARARSLAFVACGMAAVLPVELCCLFDGDELDELICGPVQVDIDVMKRNARYEGVKPTEPYINDFWTALSTFTSRELSAFIEFCSGSASPPRDDGPLSSQFLKITSPPPGSETNPDDFLPVSQTCFFSIALPKYSNAEICARKLRYAIENAHLMDADFLLRHADGWDSLSSSPP